MTTKLKAAMRKKHTDTKKLDQSDSAYLNQYQIIQTCPTLVCLLIVGIVGWSATLSAVNKIAPDRYKHGCTQDVKSQDRDARPRRSKKRIKTAVSQFKNTNW